MSVFDKVIDELRDQNGKDKMIKFDAAKAAMAEDLEKIIRKHVALLEPSDCEEDELSMSEAVVIYALLEAMAINAACNDVPRGELIESFLAVYDVSTDYLEDCHTAQAEADSGEYVTH